MSKRPKILITNDDGIFAPGIRKLIEIARPLGDLFVIAPDVVRSGMSHAITISTPLRIELLKSSVGYTEYSCNGTPVDCIKIAFHKLMKEKPDLVLSGINHGSNASINIIYSGTMAAVIESATAGIPSIGFSLCDYSENADFSHTDKHIAAIIRKILNQGLPALTCLNVNIPKISDKEIAGIKVARQANARWEEDFDERFDPHQKSYFWMKGKFINEDISNETDEYFLSQNYISVVPVTIDLTAYNQLEKIKKMNWYEENF